MLNHKAARRPPCRGHRRGTLRGMQKTASASAKRRLQCLPAQCGHSAMETRAAVRRASPAQNVAWSRVFPAMFAVQENTVAICATPRRQHLPAIRNRCCREESLEEARAAVRRASPAQMLPGLALSRPCLRFKRIPSPFAQRPADGRIPAMRNRRCGKNPWDEKRARRCSGSLRRKCCLASRFPCHVCGSGERTLPFAQRPADGRIPAMRNRRCGKNPWDGDTRGGAAGVSAAKYRLATRFPGHVCGSGGTNAAVCATP